MAFTIDGKFVGGAIPGMSAYRSAQLGGYTGTEEEFYAALAGGGGGIQMELLWENASPSSDFAEQNMKLSKSLDGYDMYEILFHPYTNATNVFLSTRTNVGAGTDLSYSVDKVYFRGVGYISSTELIFTNAKTGTTIQNHTCIPAYIYGIKGVTTNV